MIYRFDIYNLQTRICHFQIRKNCQKKQWLGLHILQMPILKTLRQSIAHVQNMLWDKGIICTIFRPEKSLSGHFPGWTFPRLTHPRLDNSQTDTSPTWHFPDQTFVRVAISPTGHFPERIFTRLHISPFYTYFRAEISLTLNNLFLTGYFWQLKCRKRLNFLVNEWEAAKKVNQLKRFFDLTSLFKTQL